MVRAASRSVALSIAACAGTLVRVYLFVMQNSDVRPARSLNFSHADLAVQLHFALFNGSSGFVLKPSQMLDNDSGSGDGEQQRDGDLYWPPSRDGLHCTMIEVLSLHSCPKVGCPRPSISVHYKHASPNLDVCPLRQHGEQRPRFSGSRSACHEYHRELSGAARPPTSDNNPSSPVLSFCVHPIGGKHLAISNS